MAICLYALPGKALIEAELKGGLEYGLVDWYSMVANDESLRVAGRRRCIPPLMLPNILNSISFSWINSQNMSQHILRIFRERLRYLVLPSQYLLVQLGGLWILKGQTSTQHRVEYYSTAPNINHNGLIAILALDHFGGSIARRPACRLEPLIFIWPMLTLPVGIAEAEVNKADGSVIINQ